MNLDEVEIFEIENKKDMYVTDRGKREILKAGSTLYAFALPDEVWCLLRRQKVDSMFIPAVHVFPNELHPAVQYEKPGAAMLHSDFIVKSPRLDNDAKAAMSRPAMR